MITFSPISVITAKSFGISMFEVNSGVTMFLFAAILFNFVSMKALEVYGLSATFKVCAVGVIVGVWIRYFALVGTGDFGVVLLGQSFIAVMQPFLYNGPSKVAT